MGEGDTHKLGIFERQGESRLIQPYRGRHLSYQRGKRNTNPGTSLIKIEGVDDTKAAKYVDWYTDQGPCSVLTDLLASTSERKLLSFTVRSERFEDQRLGSSGERSLGHTVC